MEIRWGPDPLHPKPRAGTFWIVRTADRVVGTFDGKSEAERYAAGVPGSWVERVHGLALGGRERRGGLGF